MYQQPRLQQYFIKFGLSKTFVVLLRIKLKLPFNYEFAIMTESGLGNTLKLFFLSAFSKCFSLGFGLKHKSH